MLLGESLSFFLGILSNILWFVILIPQVYTNYKLKNADAFSFGLVFMWIIGDLFSIMSSNAKGLPIIIMYSAIYHMTLALLFMIQILYYRNYNLNKPIELTNDNSEEIIDIISIEDAINEESECNEDISLLNNGNNNISRVLVRDNESIDYDNMFLLTVEEQLYILVTTIIVLISGYSLNRLHDEQKLFLADLMGWISTFIFISSRIPQIYLNYRRQSVEGLSLNSFVLINIANYLFIASILINLYDISNIDDKLAFFINNIQWIMGSFCTSFFDGIIFYQFITYK